MALKLPKPILWRWATLLALSLLLTGLLRLLGLPAAPLLGALIAAVLVAVKGWAVQLPKGAFLLAQGLVGVMIAANLPLSLFAEIKADWPIFAFGTVSTLIASSLLGWLLTRSGALPGTTALWGSSPGAATVMTVMSQDYGADMRLVAFMQYLRVACCAVAAAAAAKLLGVPGASHIQNVAHEAGLAAQATTIALGVAASYLGVRLKIPAGALLAPMVLSFLYKISGLGELSLPLPLLMVAYAVCGWSIGIRFTPEVVAHAARAFPRVFGSILALLAVSAGLAALLVHFAGIEPLTAFLATSPGGADSVSIIAASMHVNAPFVIAMQLARFFCVLLIGPALTQWLARSFQRPKGPSSGFI